MKITSTISRILLGLLFLVFGLNGFLQFLKMPPPTGTAAQFFGVLLVSHEIVVIMAIQAIGGALLLANRFVPLALFLLGPVIVNIVLFHAFMNPSGLPMAIIAAILWTLTALGVPGLFALVFRPQTTKTASL
jgi:putative oxidoreductase